MLLGNFTNIIENPNYVFLNVENFFFGFQDWYRLIIIIYIFLSLLLNLFIFFAIFKYKSNKQLSFSGIITCNILIINLFHTLSYIFNWVLKNNETTTKINNNIINVGALLTGNPSDFTICSIQGCCLIIFSLCQEYLINLLLGYIIWDGKKNKPIFILIFVLLGYIFPVCFAILFAIINFIGINEKYCFFAKYNFDINLEKDSVKYENKYGYNLCQIVYFAFRSLNFIVTIIFLIKIFFIYKTENDVQKKETLISSLPTGIVICLTSFIEIIFRILFIVSEENESKFIGLYLILNSIDSFLLPLSFIIVYKLYKFLCCKDNDKDDENKNNDFDASFQEDSLLPEEEKSNK